MNKSKLSKYSFIYPSVAMALLSLTSCNEKANPDTVFVSSSPVYILVKEIVGDIKPIELVTPGGVEAHDYEISARKIARIYDGLCLFVNGLKMESWADNLPKTAKDKTYNLSDGIDTLTINGNVDPHIWLNPKNAIKELETIKDTMISLDSSNSASYLSNYNEAVNKITALDTECEAIANNLNNKYLCVSHAAFGYMADRYELTQIAVNGLDPSQEPTTKTLEEIISVVKEYKISTIFAEEIGSKAIAEKIAKETGCKLETLSTMESVNEGDTYCSIYKENFEKIKEAGQ